ncbi:MAG: amidohydrolase family protein [Planctomycetota bacterium]
MLTQALTIAIAATPLAAQPTSDSPLADRPNGPRSAESTHHVLYNATVHPAPGAIWAPGFVEIKDGVIIDAGPIGKRIFIPPAGAQAHDLTGEHVYAAFIDPWIEVETPAPSDKADGRHWNAKVVPNRDVLNFEGLTATQRETLRDQGFAAAAIAPESGIFAGLGAVVATSDPADDGSKRKPAAYLPQAFHAIDFETAGFGRGGYPTSHPGAVALMRQTLSDAQWVTEHDRDANSSIAVLADDAIPYLFDIDMELEHFLALDIFNEQLRGELILVGNGMEFKWLSGLARERREMEFFSVVLPLRFPKKPDVSTVGKAHSTELTTMLEWEHAPANAAHLAELGMNLAFTTSKLPKGQKFFDNLQKAIDHGLRPIDAHRMLTTGPANILGVTSKLGTLEEGKIANILVTSDELFTHQGDHPTLYDLFIDGHRHRLNDRQGEDYDGEWRLLIGALDNPAFTMTFTIEGSTEGSPTITLTEGEGDDAVTDKARMVSLNGNRISFLIDDEDDGTGVYVMSGAFTNTGQGTTIIGTLIDPDSTPYQWTAVRTDTTPQDNEDKDNTEPEDPTGRPDHPGYPFGPYAAAEPPEQQAIVITNANLWTSGPEGIIENGTLVVSSGTIRYAGPAAGAPRPRGATVIDAEGKHVTPGLLDAHSHTSLFRMGVNEAGQAVTAEVRIADSLDPSAINWYRQLAMGVTTVLSLHGSANPIGGQSQTHKVRWGVHHPRDMRMQDARPGIKFALGENVKQSNWGDEYTTRYPQTRMGVETIMRDRFIAAQEYAQAIKAQEGLGARAYSAVTGKPPVRRDLELEALAEILTGERLIHCHSYRQDEILMLCRIAEDFGFTIGSFTHGLEVYKVAETVQNHSLGASIFSDWWAYKYEVVDAIPYAGPLQTEAGVLTSYNSDSDELSRRMNLEAAKAQRYAFGFDKDDPAVGPQEALNFVTINPAIQMGISDRVGSLEEGKDADFVVWSADPLSVYAVAEHTFVDGREYFSLERDAEFREQIRAERQRLVQKILEDPSKSDNDAESESESESESDSEPDTPGRRRILANYMTSGPHPDFLRQGDCGCNIINHAIYYRNMHE